MRAVALGVAAAATALVVATGTRAAANPTLTVQIVPGTISAGQPALAIATFGNGGPSTLTHVQVTFTFPVSVSVTAPGCSPSSGQTSSVSCPLGKLKAGDSATAKVTFVAPSSGSSFQVTATGTWDSGTQSNDEGKGGKGGRGDDRHTQALRGHRDDGGAKKSITATSVPVAIFASNDPTHKGTCATGQGSLEAELNGQGTALPTLPTIDPSLGLPCTPLAVGVEQKPTSSFHTDVAIVDVPKLQQPATVNLTFRDEELPGSVHNPHPLVEINNPNDPPASWTTHVVPTCSSGPTIPSGFDACIVSVTPTDPDGDADAGVIALLVQGTGLGDPRFVG